jgi:hypothetical protein
MKKLYPINVKLIILTGAFLMSVTDHHLEAQTCGSAQGNPATYGTNNVWIGYVYTGMTLSSANYQGDFTIGTASSPNFNTTFTSSSTFTPSGCSINTTNFSVRYRLTQSYSSGTYVITVGGDDGYRFSTDGGSTWTINNWNDHSYTTTTDTLTLNGSYNFVLEYYQDGGAAQVSFNITQICMGTGSQTTYGTNNVWNGYLYQGMNFQTFKGTTTEGSASSPFFDESFGNPTGNNSSTFNSTQCVVSNYQFSAIYMLKQTLTAGNYTFTVGGDDGFRLSLDGGNTWVINKWQDQSYITATYSTWLAAGTYNTVLEYYQNGGYDRLTYNNTFVALPVTVSNWSAMLQSGNNALLTWSTTDAINFDHFVIQRSTDEENFEDVATINAKPDSLSRQQYSYTDQFSYNGNVYYRLKMVDHDGVASYSGIVELPMQESIGSIRIFPTVVENGQITVDAPVSINQAHLELYDMNGRRLLAQDWAALQGRQSVSLSGNGHLASGAYIVRLTDNQTVLAKQIIIIK